MNIIEICLIAVCIGLIIWSYIIEYNRVKKTSKRYQYLLDLPKAVHAKNLQTVYTYTKYLNSKSQLDRINIDYQMMGILDSDTTVQEILSKGIYNQKKLREYNRRLALAPSYAENENKLYRIMERKLVSKVENNARPIIPSFSFNFCYSSPQGRNHYRKTYSFQLDSMIQYLNRAATEKFSKDMAKYQRSMMSDSLRYDIMKRDGFRCVLCGRNASDGIKLHVDHIIPVSKGGKTEPDNLRTLCENCNLGKRNKYDYNGCN